jgi:hypothetical protein
VNDNYPPESVRPILGGMVIMLIYGIMIGFVIGWAVYG